jgi:N-acetylmuramoyl-L-alanine amidase
MAGLERLLAGVMARWSIPPERIIAHSDMAPLRKADPGRRFDWRRLALQGLSVWPEPAAADDADFLAALRRFGYPDAAPDVVLNAFRLRFRPSATGPQDATDTALATSLARLRPTP